MKMFREQKGGKVKHAKQNHQPGHFENYMLKKDKIFSDDNNDGGKKWFTMYNDYEEVEFSQLSKEEVEKLKSEAQKLLEHETALYDAKISKNPAKSENSWIRTIMSKGTVSDKIAAHIIAIQDGSMYTLPLLRNLINLAKVSKKNECIMVIDTLTDLFLSDLLRPNKKLRKFENCPLALLDKYSSGNHVSRKSRLMYWYYEDQLKQMYSTFITALQTAAHDTVDRTKEKAISAMYKLLAGNPEQEAILLKNLVNKLGDPSQKVASKAIYSLVQLLQIHPNMKFVVMEETEKLLFRPNVGHRAQYYGICFLSQFLLTVDEALLARSLIQIYFSFFKACVKKGEVDSRLMSALLIGVNRAYPYAKQEMDKMLEHIDTMYRVVHHATFNVSMHTLLLLFQVADFANAVSDRFYSALYKKLLDPQLATSSQQALFLSLVYKALKKDEDINRVRVFFKRLLQICNYMPVPLVCGILYMISQLSNKNESLLALKMSAVNDLVQYDDDDDDDEEEHYADIKTEDSEESGDNIVEEKTSEEKDNIKPDNNDMKLNGTSIPTWFHCGNQMAENRRKNKQSAYDPLQRNPLFAGGEYCSYIELINLCQHFHPTVTLFANKILEGEVIKYPGDPLQDFALLRFLDRFVFKNPKQNIREEVTKCSKFSRKKTYMPSGIRSLRVDSASYLNEDDSKIPVDELFMYRYLKKKREATLEKKVKEEEEEDESDVSSVASEEFNEMLDNMMGGKDTDLDFADDVAKSSSKKEKVSDDDNSEDEGDEEELEDDDEELEGEDGSVDEDNEIADIMDEDLDDDAEDIIFDDSDMEDEDDDDEVKSNKKRKHMKDKLNKKKQKKDSNIFVSAEEFSEMLENMGTSKLKMSGSSALSNKDNAGEKQLKWETARDFWVKKGGKKFGKNQNKRKWESGKKDERNSKKRRKK